MKITRIKSHVLRCPMDEELGYSQAYFTHRSAHLVEVETDEGLTGWGECFGAGNVALANRAIVEQVIQPMVLGDDPLDREVIWHKVYNGLRDHGQKGMPIQALSGVDIALWDIAGKLAGQPLYKLLGGAFRQRVPVYGYGMMLQRRNGLADAFKKEASDIRAMGFPATKMKLGLGVKQDIELAEAVRDAIGPDMDFMADANHAYAIHDAMTVGKALERLGAYWFEEPVAPEDREGYRELRAKLHVHIAGGEAEFTRWGFRDLIEGRCVDILQPETCALGGITEYRKVLAMAHAHFVPVINHVWGSGVAIATNLQLLLAMPDLPGGLYPHQPYLEHDTTANPFQDGVLKTPLDIEGQVKTNGGTAAPHERPGLAIEIDRDFLAEHAVENGETPSP
ncbi:MAG: mandelate racemase/muconate lactonizing enzyme family protein [Hyphomicrobiales bacterium]